MRSMSSTECVRARSSTPITGAGTRARAARPTGTFRSSSRSIGRSSDALAAGRLQRGLRGRRDCHPFIVEPDLPDGAAAMLERDRRRASACSSSASRGCASCTATWASRAAGDVPALSARGRAATGAARSSRCRTSARRRRRCCFATTCRSRSSRRRRRFRRPTTKGSS